jgi:cation diffusion facilitator family transporter
VSSPAAVHAPGDNRLAVRRVLLAAVAVNLGLTLVKLLVALWSGSLAVLADAMHSATDGFSSLMSLLTSTLSDPRPDRDHPYGHQKFQALGSLAIAVFICITVFEILQRAVGRIQSGLFPLQLGWREWLLLLLVLGFNLALTWAERAEGRRLGSPLLRADASQSRGDLWSTVVVLAGLAAAVGLGIGWLDVVLAIPLCLLLVRLCWRVLQANLPLLVDQIAIAPEAIHAVAMDVPGVLNCHDIASRGVVGQQVFIDMHMVVEADDLPTAHRITELVEEHLESRFGPVRCTIHLEPREYASAAITFRGAHG